MIITLITDFGLSDPFVGIMKGVILGIAPQAQIVDITHDVRSYDILEAAFLIETTYRYFPAGTVHVVVVDPFNAKLYELYIGRKTDTGWQAAQSSTFDLKSNKQRPAGWTSTDAAGLPIFPAIIRHDELERGNVEHAMRFTVRNTRRAYVYPATHYASKKTDENLPRMGERYRLRRDFDTTGFSPHAKAILKGLQKYGMFMADNGGDWRLSVAPDSRIKGLAELRKVQGKDFEVIVPTGPNEGPRAKK